MCAIAQAHATGSVLSGPRPALQPDGMSTPPLTTPAAARASAALGAFLLAAVAAAVTGAVLAAGLITGGTHAHHATPAPPRAFGIGDDVPASFGFIAVEHAKTLKGLTARQLGGAVHGIGTFVGRDRALVQASVTITNTSTSPIRYDPRQFRLVARRPSAPPRRIAAAHASVIPGTLQPDAAIDARLSFVVPRDGSRMSLAFDDPGRDAPIVIGLDQRSGRVTAREKRELRSAHGGAAGHQHDQ
jgi:hypothetical protein